jgi:hypothetical protein
VADRGASVGPAVQRLSVMPQEPRDKPAVLHYGVPTPRRHGRFLAKFCRHLLFGLLLIGFGMGSLPSPNDPQDTRAVCFALMIAGAVVVIASLVHAIGAYCGKWQDDEPAA